MMRSFWVYHLSLIPRSEIINSAIVPLRKDRGIEKHNPFPILCPQRFFDDEVTERTRHHFRIRCLNFQNMNTEFQAWDVNDAVLFGI